MKTKYKIKDKVEYWESSFSNTKAKKKTGLITKIHKDLIIRGYGDLTATQLPEIKPSIQEPVYTIDGCGYTEDEIIKKI